MTNPTTRSLLVCVTCDTILGEASNPPPSGICPNCRDTRLEIVHHEVGAAAIRSAASVSGRASSRCLCGAAQS